MATYYVSKNGSDSNNGLGPDASHGTNKPWLTINKAVDTATSGDTIYIAPGIYREAVTVGANPVSEMAVLGDPLNSQGFKDGSGSRLSAGRVVLTGFTTDDVTTSTTVPLDLSNKNYLRIENLEVIAGNAVAITGLNGDHLTFKKLVVWSAGSSALGNATYLADEDNVVLFDSCIIYNFTLVWFITLTKSASAEYNCGVIFRNCFLAGLFSIGLRVSPTGASAFYGGGLLVENCTLVAATALYTTTGGSTTYPITAKNCVIHGALNVAASGNGVDSYCWVTGSRTNWTAGTGSVVTGARNPHYNLGQAWLWNLPKATQPFWGLFPESGLLGFGNDSSPPATDMLGVSKPSGSGVIRASSSPSIGSFESYNYGTKDTSTKDASDASLKMTGPGTQFIRVPVNASSTTFSIKVRYESSTYGGTNYPQAILLANGELGITTETETATVSASDAWETLTFTAQTPLAKGYVEFWLVNRTNDADGLCWFDTLSRS